MKDLSMEKMFLLHSCTALVKSWQQWCIAACGDACVVPPLALTGSLAQLEVKQSGRSALNVLDRKLVRAPSKFFLNGLSQMFSVGSFPKTFDLVCQVIVSDPTLVDSGNYI